MVDLSRTAAIVGVAESDEIGTVPNKSSLQHHMEAAHNALEDAGLSKNDVDGLFTAGYSTYATGDYLGIQPRFTDSTSVGGSSFIIHIAHAIAAINAGYCEVALITHGQAGRSNRAPQPGDPSLPTLQYEIPYGFHRPAHQLRHGRHPVHARVRRGAHTAGAGGGSRFRRASGRC